MSTSCFNISNRCAANEKWWNRVLPNLREHCSPNLLAELIHQDQLTQAVHAARVTIVKEFQFLNTHGDKLGPCRNECRWFHGGGMVRDIGTFEISNHHIVSTDALPRGKIDNCRV